jgi:hypothetical protein
MRPSGRPGVHLWVREVLLSHRGFILTGGVTGEVTGLLDGAVSLQRSQVRELVCRNCRVVFTFASMRQCP